MSHLLHYAVVLGLCGAGAAGLARSRWPARAPRTAVVVWQALGLAAVLSAVGLLLAAGLEPYRVAPVPALSLLAGDVLAGTPTARTGLPGLGLTGAGLLLGGWLAGAHVLHVVDAARRRRRHRTLLGLVARSDAAAEGALVVDHPLAVAYCVPGWSAKVVVSAGTLDLLSAEQLRAVLAHERAHARERHHLVLLPFAALLRALPRSRSAGRVLAAVELLVEMCADDRAARRCTARPLVDALVRFQVHGAAATPPGTLGAAGGPVHARILRLLDPTPAPAPGLRVLALAAAGAVLATPLSLLVFPLWG